MTNLKHRVGVIPFSDKGSQSAILLITSLTRSRWIFPKGKLELQESHEDGCKREAFEEAGITGKVFNDFPITTLITSASEGKIEKFPVTFYPFSVQKQLDDWPEKQKRLEAAGACNSQVFNKTKLLLAPGKKHGALFRREVENQIL